MDRADRPTLSTRMHTAEQDGPAGILQRQPVALIPLAGPMRRNLRSDRLRHPSTEAAANTGLTPDPYWFATVHADSSLQHPNGSM